MVTVPRGTADRELLNRQRKGFWLHGFVHVSSLRSDSHPSKASRGRLAAERRVASRTWSGS